MSYSEAARRAITAMPAMTQKLGEREKELYSKECVAESINFAVGAASEEATDLMVHERFSCYLATILARDKEVVAVRLKIFPNGCEIYLSKNFPWTDEDHKYIDKIENYLKDISNAAPRILKDTECAFTQAVKLYCSAKLESRLEKLKKDIKNNGDTEYVKSFKDFFSTEVNDKNEIKSYMMSQVCMEYYKEVKDKPNIPSKFLGHIKKVGSYAGSMLGIIECARNILYKSTFSKIKVLKGIPDIIDNQPIYSWKNIIERFIDEDKYKRFMDKCSEKPKVMERRRKVYTDKVTQQQQPLDGNDVKQCIYLHAEMSILALIINSNIKSREFIAVSKRCCYLCELYIDFARRHGYNIIVSGNHKKIYSGWKLPNVKDNNFKTEALRYILENLDQIIENKVNHYTSSLQADSDSLKNSGKYLREYFQDTHDSVFTLRKKSV